LWQINDDDEFDDENVLHKNKKVTNAQTSQKTNTVSKPYFQSYLYYDQLQCMLNA